MQNEPIGDNFVLHVLNTSRRPAEKPYSNT